MGLYAWHEGWGAPIHREAEDIPEVFLLLSDVAALLDARLLTGEGTEVVELSATYLTELLDSNLSMKGLSIVKIRSTPTPSLILRTVKRFLSP